MNGNNVFLNCMAEEGNPERISARDYLLIPLSKRVYIVLNDGSAPRSIISICENIIAKEQDDFVIYVFCGRESGIGDKIKETFGESSAVKAIIVGNKVEMYLKAADVIFSKFSLFSEQGKTVAYKPAGKTKIAFSKAYRSIGGAISAAKRFLERR
ncbi:MAG: hypothetical protein J6112_06465 [Clostridia bacterium]|nr:hypothetical protein [Clostridia bacterium]